MPGVDVDGLPWFFWVALPGGFIGVPERMKTMQITKRHLT